MSAKINRSQADEQAVTLLRGLVEQIKPEVREIPNVLPRIVNILEQVTLTRVCCAEILAYWAFPSRDTSFSFLNSALLSGGLKDAEMKKLIAKLPEDKRHLFEPLLGVRSFDFFEISQMSIIPFHIFFQTLKTHSGGSLPLDLVKLYHRIPENERTSENQKKLGDLVGNAALVQLFKDRSTEMSPETKSLQHLLQNLPEWKPKK